MAKAFKKKRMSLRQLLASYVAIFSFILVLGFSALYAILSNLVEEHDHVYSETLSTFLNADRAISFSEPVRFLLSDIQSSLQVFNNRFELLTLDPDYNLSDLQLSFNKLKTSQEKLERYKKYLPNEYNKILSDNLKIVIDIGEELIETSSSNARQQLYRDSQYPITEVYGNIKLIGDVINRLSVDTRRQIQSNIISAKQEHERFSRSIDRLVLWIVLASVLLVITVVFSQYTFYDLIKKRMEVLKNYAISISNEEYSTPPFRANDATGHLAVQLAMMGRKIRKLVDSVRLHSRRTTRALEAMEEIANKDALTGLSNRRSFHVLLQEAISIYYQQRQKIIVLFIDLDNFKHINDSMGHDVGDELLKVIAGRLKNEIRSEDYLARLGGDEFAIIAFHQKDSGLNLLHRIKQSITQPVMLNGRELYITVSTGVSEIDDDIASPIELLRRADLAMYHAKAKGRNTHQHFNLQIQKQVDDEINLSSDIDQALEEKEFELYYQPQYCLRSRGVKGVEALIRWRQPEHGWVAPDLFIPIAEKTGIIHRIDNWVIDEACKQAASFKEHYLSLRVAINISPNQFSNKDFVSLIKANLDRYGLEPQLLEVEITERMLVKDFKRAKNTLESLRDLGVSIALDDFGTGYSSLNYLRQLPLDVLKIDKDFVSNMLEFRKEKAIVKTIIDLGNDLDMLVIAEGVETEKEESFLRDSGCHIAQGYHFSRPMPINSLRDLLQKDSNIIQFSS